MLDLNAKIETGETIAAFLARCGRIKPEVWRGGYSSARPFYEEIISPQVVAWLVDRLAYWQRGHEIIEKRLATAARADWQDAPFPLNEEQAALWHRAQAEAYRDALEMMGVPDPAFEQPVLKTAEAAS